MRFKPLILGSSPPYLVAYVHGIMVNFYYAVISYPVTLFVMGRVGGTKIEIADGFRTTPA